MPKICLTVISVFLNNLGEKKWDVKIPYASWHATNTGLSLLGA